MSRSAFVSLSFALAASSLWRCGPPSSPIARTFDPCALTISVASDAGDELRAAAEQALPLWNDLGVANVTIPQDPAAAQVPVRFEQAAPAFYGLYDDERAEILLNRSLVDPRTIAIVLSHELGHAMGLYHVPPDVRPSVMNPGNLLVAPTAADAQAVHALWGECPSR